MQIPSALAKILVVEDEPGVLDLVPRQLRSLGYEVAAVATAAEALHLLSMDDSFDLLFTDIVMPGQVNGVELACRARQAFGPELKILLTSGYPEETFQRSDRPDPDVSLLRKPYRAAELAAAVSAALSTSATVG